MIPNRLHSPLLLLAGAALAPLAAAGTITGRVVAPNGSGVPFVDILPIDHNGGGDGNIANGGTDANGNFAATIDNGTYDFHFRPPVPPTTTFLVGVVNNITVNGTINLGTITLEQGVSVQGRLVNPSNQGVPGVLIDIDRHGQNVVLRNDITDATGNFLLAVPIGPIELQFDPTAVPGTLLAPTSFDLNLSTNTNLGTNQLPLGFVVTAIVRKTNGTAVSGADIDVNDSVTGQKLYTPSDNTDNNGFVDFVVRAGTFDIEFCAPTVQRLVTLVMPNVVVNATKNLGVVTMQTGVMLSGHVQSGGGAAVVNCDLDVFNSSTGAPIPTCLDNTDANGNYALIVPTGTFDIVFTPDYLTPYASSVVTGFTVNADRVLNRTLSSCDGAVSTGSGTPGTGGRTPQIAATGGYLRVGNPNWMVNVTNGRGGATAFLTVSAGSSCGFTGGTSWTPMRKLGDSVVFTLGGTSGGAGQGFGSVSFPLPQIPALAGLEINGRVFVIDPQASGGLAKTPLLCGTFCD